MGLFSSKSKSSSTTTVNNTNLTSGDFSSGNIMLADSEFTYNGFNSDDLKNVLSSVNQITSAADEISDKAINATQKAASESLEGVASAYQSAYSETTGMLQQLKPVLLVGISVLAIFFVPKLWRKMK